jgi:hypothetical protein
MTRDSMTSETAQQFDVLPKGRRPADAQLGIVIDRNRMKVVRR